MVTHLRKTRKQLGENGKDRMETEKLSQVVQKSSQCNLQKQTNSSPKRTKRSRCVCESIFSCGRPQTRPVQSCQGLDITSQKETARPTKAEYVARARLLLVGLRASAALNAGLGFQARPPLPGGHAKRSRTFLRRKDLVAPVPADNTPKENHFTSPPFDFGF